MLKLTTQYGFHELFLKQSNKVYGLTSLVSTTQHFRSQLFNNKVGKN